MSRVDTANIVKRGVRPLVTICEGHQLCFQQPHKSCVSNDANLLQRYALKWKIIQPKIAEKDMSKNKQEKEVGSRCFPTSAHNARPAMPGVSGNFGIQRVNIRWDHYCEGSGIQGSNPSNMAVLCGNPWVSNCL